MPGVDLPSHSDFVTSCCHVGFRHAVGVLGWGVGWGLCGLGGWCFGWGWGGLLGWGWVFWGLVWVMVGWGWFFWVFLCVFFVGLCVCVGWGVVGLGLGCGVGVWGLGWVVWFVVGWGLCVVVCVCVPGFVCVVCVCDPPADSKFGCLRQVASASACRWRSASACRWRSACRSSLNSVSVNNPWKSVSKRSRGCSFSSSLEISSELSGPQEYRCVQFRDSEVTLS